MSRCRALLGGVGLQRLAEADRNRTCQTELLGLTDFEDRGDHQEPTHLPAAQDSNILLQQPSP